MNSPQNYFRIRTANIYISGAGAAQEKEPGAGMAFDSSCPAPGDVINVQAQPGSALGTISAWVSYSQPPVSVRAFIYPDEHFTSLAHPIAFNPNSVLAVRKGGLFSWTQVPGANHSKSGNINHLVVWSQQSPGGPWTYSGDVTFSGSLIGGTVCGSGLQGAEYETVYYRSTWEGSGLGSGLDCGPGSGPCAWLGSGLGSGLTFQHNIEATFPAMWKLEISGLEGKYQPQNNVYILRSASAAPTWENGGDAKSHCRVTMNYSAESRCWILMVLWNGISLSAEAPAHSPFGPLQFLVHGTSATHGKPHIVAIAVGI